MSNPKTRERLLQAAEDLFSEKGYAGTSLREITQRAAANLAAVNYHFGSKEGLLQALVELRIGPMNEERLHLLDQAEAEAGGRPLPVERIVEIFLAPATRALARPSGEHPCLIGRLHHEPHLELAKLLHGIFRPIHERFLAALRRSLPGMGEEELLLRMSFMVGALIHTLGFAREQVAAFSQGGVGLDDPERVLASLRAFCIGGFRHV